MLNLPADLSVSLSLNCQVILDSCVFCKFSLVINILYVETYILFSGLVEFCQGRLIQPERFAFEPDFNFRLAAFGLIYEYLPAFGDYVMYILIAKNGTISIMASWT